MSGLTRGTVIESFGQIEQGLRDWRSFVDRDAYDVGGMVTLLCACLENLRKNVPAAEMTHLGAQLSEEERAQLKILAESE
jgi:hypothetical protein